MFVFVSLWRRSSRLHRVKKTNANGNGVVFLKKDRHVFHPVGISFSAAALRVEPSLGTQKGASLFGGHIRVSLSLEKAEDPAVLFAVVLYFFTFVLF